MSTSGTYNFSLTRDSICKAALRITGVIGKGEEPSQEDLDETVEALNVILKSWAISGPPLWTIVERKINLQPGVHSYAFGGGGIWNDLTQVGVNSETEGTNPNDTRLGGVIEIEIVSGGTGYSVAPTVVISGDGVNATATATLTSGVVTSITVTNAGSRYSYPPEITFVGTNTTPCVAIARISGSGGGTDLDSGSAGEGRPGSAGSVSYNPIGGNAPLKIVHVFSRDRDTGSDTQITILSRYEYLMLGNKLTGGYVHSVYPDHQLGSLILYVYNVPTDDSRDLHLWVQRPIQDAGDEADIVDFPVEFYEALKWNLADAIAIESGTNMNLLDRIEKKAMMSKEAIVSYNQEEASVYFTPHGKR